MQSCFDVFPIRREGAAVSRAGELKTNNSLSATDRYTYRLLPLVLCTQPANKETNQPINEPTNKRTNQPNNRPTNDDDADDDDNNNNNNNGAHHTPPLTDIHWRLDEPIVCSMMCTYVVGLGWA